MGDESNLRPRGQDPAWVVELATKRPDMVMMAPFMAFLFCLPLEGFIGSALGKEWLPIGIVTKGAVGFWVYWVFRRHFPPLGKPHLLIAVAAAAASTVLWVGGQYLFDGVEIAGKSLGGKLFWPPLSPIEVTDPSEGLSDAVWWTQATLKIAVACLTVPIVEEIFWRGFMLRALIDWDRFEEIPLGKFTLFAFVGTALLSTLQHPANWGVSIFCWMAWNALMYWKKSLLCLMITHGLTNLFLYLYVIHQGAWQFW